MTSEPFSTLVDGLARDSDLIETLFYRYLRQCRALEDIVRIYAASFQEVDRVLDHLIKDGRLHQDVWQQVYDLSDVLKETRRQTDTVEQEIRDGRLGVLSQKDAILLGVCPERTPSAKKPSKRERRIAVDPATFAGSIDTNGVDSFFAT